MKRTVLTIVAVLALAGCGAQEAEIDTAAAQAPAFGNPWGAEGVPEAELPPCPTEAAGGIIRLPIGGLGCEPTLEEVPQVAPTPEPECHPAYREPCVPPNRTDVNCPEIGERVYLVDPAVDPYKLDEGGESGVGCEQF